MWFDSGRRSRLAVAAAVVVALSGAAAAGGAGKNLFANGGFELGRSPWRMDTEGKTSARFSVDTTAAGEGRHSGLISMGTVEGWGVQFGQRMDAGAVGKTYTFAALARAESGSPAVRLEIERTASPWDRAVRSDEIELARGKWTELHVTFKVTRPMREGWFAYASCRRARCSFRLDGLRLYEGPYVPHTEQAAAVAAAAGVRVFDTKSASPRPLAPRAIGAAAGWVAVAAGEVAHRFAGDVVVRNSRLAVVLRRGGGGAEVHTLDEGLAGRRAVLVPVIAGAARAGGSLTAVELTDNGAGGAALDATFRSPDGKTATIGFAVQIGHVHVETVARSGASGLRVDAPCRYAVLPDFFADDMVLDAAKLPIDRAELPLDHFMLQLLPGRDAIVVTVRDTAGGDVPVTLAGKGEARMIRSAEVPYGKTGGRIAVAALAAEGIWHERQVRAADRGRIVGLNWRRPFAAQWRVDWRKDDGLADSWQMAVQRADGKFDRESMFGGAIRLPANRNRWTTVLGRFAYPCWIDRGGRGFLQPLKRGVRFEGPVIVYPINRSKGTPLDRHTIVDIVRSTLGVGPCEYILDVEGQKDRSKGIATCAARSTLNPIYQAGRQRSERARIEKALVDVMVFIRFIRSRIEQYVAFGHEIRAYLADRKRADPELAGQIEKLEALAKAIDERFAARRGTIKTPADAQKLADRFRQTMLDYEGPDALKKCKVYTEAWVAIGGNQDELVGECRLAVKVLRQRSGLMAAVEPRLAPIAREIRRRSQAVLRAPAGHEGAEH